MSDPIRLHVSSRGALELPERAIARGPRDEGQPLAGTMADLYGEVWALSWVRNGPLVLEQLQAGAWVEREPVEPLPELTETARHISLCFDQAARPVIAWQTGTNIFVRQWDGFANAYAIRGPFEGHDPVVYMDALASLNLPDSDVILFHLSADRLQLVRRLQRDLYEVPAQVATLPEPLYLDQVVTRSYIVRLYLGTDTGDENTGRLEAQILDSDYYPIPLRDAGTLTPAAGRADYVEMLAIRPVSDAGTLTPAAGRADYVEVLRIYGAGLTSVTAALTPAAGRADYVEVLRIYPESDAGALTVAPGTVEYRHTLMLEQTTEPAALTVAPGRVDYRAV